MSKIQLTLKSGNKKTGIMPVSMSERETCPKSCPFYDKGCYALYGPCRMHWGKVDQRGDDYSTFCAKVKALPDGQIWRHNQCGDLAGKNECIDSRKLAKLASANRGKIGYSYTHKQCIKGKYSKANRKAIKQANKNGFCVNLSGNNPSHADQLVDLGIGPVTVVLPVGAPRVSLTPKGNKIVTCPAQVKEGMTCEKCKLCAKPNRTLIVGFISHGAATKTVSEKVKG